GPPDRRYLARSEAGAKGSGYSTSLTSPSLISGMACRVGFCGSCALALFLLGTRRTGVLAGLLGTTGWAAADAGPGGGAVAATGGVGGGAACTGTASRGGPALFVCP